MREEAPQANDITEKEERDEIQPIASAINETLDKLALHRTLIGMALNGIIKESEKRVRSARKLLKEAEKLQKSGSPVNEVIACRDWEKANYILDSVPISDMVELQVNSLYISLFSTFDEFTGNLINAVYVRKPELYSSIDRSISLKEILTYDTLEDVKGYLLAKEIETIRRSSYTEQFIKLGNIFGMELRKFDKWAEFIEAGQRRNLITHCGGVVSEQYLAACKEVGYKQEKLVDIGTKLTVDPHYFINTVQILMEIVLMLGQCIWRKLFVEEIEDADRHINNVIFTTLIHERWPTAAGLSHLAMQPIMTSKSKDVFVKIRVVNYAIAIKYSNDDSARMVKTLLDKTDWSGSLLDFKLAVHVLKDEYGEAAQVMQEIGKEGELVDELAYYRWPLFREFRSSKEFLAAYNAIYGYSFAQKIQKSATVNAKIEKIEEETSRISHTI